MNQYRIEFAGRTLQIETGQLAKQAGGSVLIRYGDTALLVTATVSPEPREGKDFFPLTVDYEERLYAVGRIPGGFTKRESRPTDKAILTARLTDRPLRPLFPKGFRNSVHIVATVLSVDLDCAPEPLAIIGASAALSISPIPFSGPVASVVVGIVDGEYVINPTTEESERSTLNLVIAGTKDAVMMVEAGAKEITAESMLEAVMKGHDALKEIITLQEQMIQEVGKPKMEVTLFLPEEELINKVRDLAMDRIEGALQTVGKLEKEEALGSIQNEIKEQLIVEYTEKEQEIKDAFEIVLKEVVRRQIIQKRIRPDGRKPKEIRPISCQVGLLPRAHGSGLFTRGQTQVLNICTLGPLGDVQRLDGIGLEDTKRFMHHYNFPPFSTGETGFMRGPGRREIGHGSLAERAISPVIPGEKDFPYTIRLVSEVMESNGSTSMGSVCASSLSLMDAGIPISKPVSGVAMGLIMADEPVILTDIQGMEDFYGDMDFKVAGTEDGITALQMDIKIKGLSRELLAAAITQAREGYLFILGEMLKVIDVPREEMSPYAPRIITFQINPDKIRDVVGPGGKIINKIIADTSADIDIESDGRVFISSLGAERGEKAKKIIDSLLKEVEAGETYLGKVMRIEKYGAFVEILPGKDGLVHISQLAPERVEKTEDVVSIGDEIMVKVIGIDDRGRIDLSRKALMVDDAAEEAPPKRRERENTNYHRNNNSRFGRGGRKRIE